MNVTINMLFRLMKDGDLVYNFGLLRKYMSETYLFLCILENIYKKVAITNEVC